MAATGTPAPQRPTRPVRGPARSRGAVPVAAPGLPPGPRLPAAVQTAGWVARPLGMLERARARHGDAFTLRILNEGPWVVLSHPDMVRDVFTGDPDVLRSGEANQILRPTLGEHSVLVLDGERHLRQRRLLLPPFHGERMQRYGALVRAIAEREVATWPRHRPFALAPRMAAVTLEVIMRAVFGVRDVERLALLRERLPVMLARSIAPWQMLAAVAAGPDRTARSARTRAIRRPVDELLLDEIARRRTAPDLAEREDVLSLLVQARHEDGSPMGDDELRDELMTLLVAGHETTATALSWAIERLVRHPGAWRRLREEAVSGDADDYADAVCKETLRLRPVVPLVVRRVHAPVTVGGVDLPAGVTAVPCIHLVHRRADVYPEPDRFRPERFLERPAGTYTWFPFGGGTRRCLGAAFALFEMRTVLRVVAAQAELRPARPEPERVGRRSITLVPARGGEVVVA
jgi:cytochrome P450 family 135